MDYDALIIGSGFGGSVAALRLSEKDYRVAVLEQGRRIQPEDIEAASESPARLFWSPGLGMNGYFTQRTFRHLTVIGGVGVGGGSLVYAAVLLEPGHSFFDDPAWNDLGIEWHAELKPHYETARRMLGCEVCPRLHEMDEYIRLTAETLGAGQTFEPVPLGIYFGQPDVTAPDPYFGGRGPDRRGCIECGECLIGCAYNAKNSLDLNYLYLAEKLGAVILPERKVTLIRPLQGGGYEVEMAHPFRRGATYLPLQARTVVLAAGVLGTLELLFRCRDVEQTLPDLSPRLGEVVRTNSEALLGVLSDSHDIDLTKGPAISSHFYNGPHTHITPNRYAKVMSFVRWYGCPLIDDPIPWRRALKTLAAFVLHPVQSTVSWRARDYTKRVTTMTVMQALDNHLSFRYGRGLLTGFRRGLQSVTGRGKRAPTYIPEANQAAREYARVSGGTAGNGLLETLLNQSVTAHILGGCQIGRDREHAVIDSSHQVFGYPGLYVVDGSAVPANVGVNPTLTITALAERCLSQFPAQHRLEA